MGGRGSYSQRGGFSKREYRATGETIGGFKVIEKIAGGSASLPEMSNTPGTVYILRKENGRMKLGVYGNDRRLRQEFEIDHKHTNRPKSGKKETLIKDVAHVHNLRGGRGANVRYMTKKEIRKYGAAIIAMGGRVR